ncbi:MAG: RNA polymerase sigma factor [Elusimicrobia bacterium]|nr:RNA polymerase sigma factor [Candidatus Liberimonas magnetica]
MAELTDEEIVQSVLAGNTEMFKEIVRKHAAMVYSVCYRLMGNEHDASDLAQEVFLSALKSIKDFKNRSLISTWLYSIAVNKGINLCNRRKKVKFYSIDTKTDASENMTQRNLGDLNTDVENIVHNKNMKDILEKQLSKLNPEKRAIIVLRYIEDKSYEEIAEICDCPIGTVGSRLARALDELRENLKEIFGERYAL